MQILLKEKEIFKNITILFAKCSIRFKVKLMESILMKEFEVFFKDTFFKTKKWFTENNT